MTFDTLAVTREEAVLFVAIEAPPMNLLGPEVVRDLVSLINETEPEEAVKVLVFKSADRDYFISHVDLNRVKEYRQEAAKLAGEPSLESGFDQHPNDAQNRHCLDRGVST